MVRKRRWKYWKARSTRRRAVNPLRLRIFAQDATAFGWPGRQPHPTRPKRCYGTSPKCKRASRALGGGSNRRFVAIQLVDDGVGERLERRVHNILRHPDRRPAIA